MTPLKKLNSRGFSLMQALVSLGIIATASLAFMNLISSVNTEQRSLDERLNYAETRNSLLTAFTSAKTCKEELSAGFVGINLSDATTTTPSSQVVNYSELRAGPSASSPLIVARGQSLPGVATGRMIVENIRLGSIYSTGNPNEFKGTIRVSFSPTSLLRSLKPIEIDQIFVTSGPISEANFEACGTSTSSPATAPTSNLTNCTWVSLPGQENGNEGYKEAVCPGNGIVAGLKNYRGGDWTRTGHFSIYCCQLAQ